MSPRYSQDATPTARLRLVAWHKRRRRATRQRWLSLHTQRQDSTPCDSTSALNSVSTNTVAHYCFRHQRRATWLSFALALPHRCIRSSLQMAKSACRQHYYIERRDQLSRGTVFKMGSADKNHHRKRQAVCVAPD